MPRPPGSVHTAYTRQAEPLYQQSALAAPPATGAAPTVGEVRLLTLTVVPVLGFAGRVATVKGLRYS
jgi:hypothetical protein